MTNKESGFRENGYCNLPPYEMSSLKKSNSSDRRGCRPVSESSETESQGMVESERMTNTTPLSENSVPEADADTTLVDDAEDGDGTSTIRRMVKPEPIRPPRSIDGHKEGFPPASKDYYNLVNPPPEEEEQAREESVPPTLPRRKPLIASPDSPKRHTLGSTEIPRPRPLSTHSCFTFSKTAPDSEGMGQKVAMAKGGAINTLGRSFRKKYLSRRRRGTQCHCKNAGTGESKDEVILLYSRHCAGSMEWAKYLHKLFTELSKHKGRLRMRHLPLEDLTPSLPPTMEAEIFNARLQLVVVSPLFLQWVYRNPGMLVGRLLQQDRVIALLLGVKDTQVTPEHRSSLISFPQWVHLEARDHDLEFVQTVLYFSTQILQRTEPRLASKSESLYFSVFPRKVTEFLNKVMIVLDKPVNSRAIVKVSLEKSNSQKVLMEDHDVKVKNPYNFLVTIPVCFFSVSSIVNIHLEVDGESRGFRQVKCESKMNELDTVLTSVHEPLEFLCQSMGISPPCKDQLDETLTNNLMSNIPKHGFPLLSFSGSNLREHQQHKKQSCEFPSLLHFSAAHGLEQLTCALLDCPGAEDALSLRNVTDLTPPEMATANGFYDLGEILKTHHHSPSNFSHIYDYIKHGRMSGPREMSTLRHARPMSHCTDASIGTSVYSSHDPEPESLYQVPPPPRPLPMSPGSCSPPSQKPGAYLDMSGSNSGTPSPCQKRRPNTNLWAANIKKKGNLQTNLFGTSAGPQRISSSSSGPDDSPLFRHLPSSSLVQNEEDKYEEILDSAATLKSKMTKNNNRDPFGTLRASQGRRSMREKTKTNQEPEMQGGNRLISEEGRTGSARSTLSNDPFGTMRASRASSVKTHISSSQDDVFTTEELESNMVRPGPPPNNHVDYRGISNDEHRDDLAVTDELLDLLEDFKAKSYTVKEMEVLFENWRRKASIGDEHIDVKNIQKDDLDTLKDKLCKTKTTYSLLKMFRSSSKSQADPKIKRTQSTKKYMKPSSPAFTEETIIGNIDLNESELSMVALPPTPLKPKEKSPQTEGVSSQILPLSRLSTGSLPQPTYKQSPKQKPIAEVSPFSNKQNAAVVLSASSQAGMEPTTYSQVGMEAKMDHQVPSVPNNTMAETPNSSNVITTMKRRPSITPPAQLRTNVPIHSIPMPQKATRDLKTSPMKEKLQKLRRSITEPLLHYLNEMHMMSPESEEPDILNTPKSVTQTKEEREKRLSKNLFGSRSTSDSSMIRHPAPSSQVHEYENISPTPSTDL